MPPRYAYWTIIAGGLPTAFRAADREDLLPTFQRIKEKHPDAQMKWFARGKLWESPEAARAAQPRGARNQRDARGPAHARERRESRPEPRSRDRSWRPGGEHRDPRQKFIDAKKQRNASLRKERWERKNAAPGVPRDRDERKPWERKKPWTRSQGTDEPKQPPRPRGPNREPKPSENPRPTAPPQPKETITPPPGPPEQGRPRERRPFRAQKRFSRGPRGR